MYDICRGGFWPHVLLISLNDLYVCSMQILQFKGKSSVFKVSIPWTFTTNQSTSHKYMPAVHTFCIFCNLLIFLLKHHFCLLSPQFLVTKCLNSHSVFITVFTCRKTLTNNDELSLYCIKFYVEYSEYFHVSQRTTPQHCQIKQWDYCYLILSCMLIINNWQAGRRISVATLRTLQRAKMKRLAGNVMFYLFIPFSFIRSVNTSSNKSFLQRSSHEQDLPGLLEHFRPVT